MPNFEHKKIAEQLIALDTLPSQSDELINWIKAEAHIEFLERNANTADIVIYGVPEYSYIYTMAVPERSFNQNDINDLLNWSVNPSISAASYVWGGGRDDVWVEDDFSGRGSNILDDGMHLIYHREFKGWAGEDRDYFELHQKFAHLADIHWRPEHSSYCQFDENGDLKQVVSVTKQNSKSNLSLVTFDRSSIDSFLAASGMVLVRCFDFTLLNRSKFSGWGDEDENIINYNESISYRQKICGHAAYTRGVQIIRPQQSRKVIFSKIKGHLADVTEAKYVEFITQDWRNQVIANVSTDPKGTTNYFTAKDNVLPFELSPAFFKPEVLLKYKADKEKYTVQERDIYCRAAWRLEAFDINEAGQVFAYICYLRRLPYAEQLHWLSYNEKPKTSISERAYINDFEGQFVSFINSLEKIKHICRAWKNKNLSWWSLKSERLIDQVTVPVTASRDEWAESFLLLTQLVIEGFNVSSLRNHLESNGITYDKQNASITLLEKVINTEAGEGYRLVGLRAAQNIRTKAKGHIATQDSDNLAQEAIMQFGGYAAHFNHVCETICEELEIIQNNLDK